MQARSKVTQARNYRPPRVSVLGNRHDTQSEKEDADEDTKEDIEEGVEEEDEWSDDDDSQESSNGFRRTTPTFYTHGYDENLNGLQNRLVRRFDTQPTPDYTPDPDFYNGHRTHDPATAPQRHSNMSSNSPGGQAVPYGPYPSANPFLPYQGQHYDPSPQYYPSPPRYIPPPPQFYPEVESIRQELEDMKMESKERERRIEKQQEEESRKKKKRVQLQKERKLKQQEEAQKMAFEAQMQQMKADFDKRLESVTKAARHRDQTADLHAILSHFLPPKSAADHHGRGHGYNAQDKQAYDMSAIMKRLDSLAATERQAHHAERFRGQGPSTRYHGDQPVMDDPYNQIDQMKRLLYDCNQIVSELLPNGEYYHPPHRPRYPTSPLRFSPAASSSSSYNHARHPDLTNRPPRKRRAGRASCREPYFPTAVFSEVEEPPEKVKPPKFYWRYASDGENSASGAVAGHLVDENHQAAGDTSGKVRKQRQPSHKRPEASEHHNATRVAPYDRKSMAAQEMGAREEDDYDTDSGHSSDVSDEAEAEACKHRPAPYAFRPDERFGREVPQARDRHAQPFDQFPYNAEDHVSSFRAPTPPPPPSMRVVCGRCGNGA
ncbi:hypothetical protein F4859DRAFT_457362 [Xylaria cf. heliscus]|nr:hypothetical protein F4859DRAFT_457362 [Xylaria cf. heliscus]